MEALRLLCLHVDPALEVMIFIINSSDEIVSTYLGNPLHTDSDVCVFPFKFMDEWHFTCILDEESPENPWCSLTRDFDEDGRYGFCRIESKNCLN